ncbi:hypothetical protein B0188_07300 [[Haemophilus] felis]|uniref:Glycosyltransferase 2-like domain-containing protein n=1 Tax=[Haemophilus] felis TaxID=123822 RepID=A0A1T0AZB6_9PAST|nr:hypothetical protein B0188_07300 [[Haemophilus] felis]
MQSVSQSNSLAHENNENIFFYIVIPCYERAKLTQRAINSVLKQKYENYHLLICNDGSSEDYGEIANLVKGNCQVTYLINQENLGLNKTINRLLDFCFENFNVKTKDYLFILDNDDYLINEDVLALISQEIHKSRFSAWLCFNCESKTLDIDRLKNSNYAEYLEYTYKQYREDYRGDKHHVFNLKAIENFRYTTLYKNGYEHIFYFKLPFKINIVPKTVKVIQYYPQGLSDILYKKTTLLDICKHFYELPFNSYSYKMLMRYFYPKEILKRLFGEEKYYAMKKKLGFPDKRK